MSISILLVSIILLTSFKDIPSDMQSKNPPEKKDPMERFHECRDKFYTAYPDEIIETDWHKCMQRKKNEVLKTKRISNNNTRP
jgi:hypothetical protein